MKVNVHGPVLQVLVPLIAQAVLLFANGKKTKSVKRHPDLELTVDGKKVKGHFTKHSLARRADFTVTHVDGEPVKEPKRNKEGERRSIQRLRTAGRGKAGQVAHGPNALAEMARTMTKEQQQKAAQAAAAKGAGNVGKAERTAMDTGNAPETAAASKTAKRAPRKQAAKAPAKKAARRK